MDQDRRFAAHQAGDAGFSRRSMVVGGGAGLTGALIAALAPSVRATAAQEAAAEDHTGQFLVLRRYTLAAGASIEEVVRRTEEGFVPILRELPGFVEYFNVDLGDGEGATISLFTSQTAAEASTEQAAAWVQEHVAALIAGPPEILQGPVLLDVMAETPA